MRFPIRTGAHVPSPAPVDTTAEQLAAALERIRLLELRLERLEYAVTSTVSVTLPPLAE